MLKYMEIAAKIEQYIIDNEFDQGTKLPSFSELIQEYGVSKSTIVKALDVLERNGIIYQIQGSGIFVRRNKRIGYVNLVENHGFTQSLEEFEITSKVLKLEKRRIFLPNYLSKIKKKYHFRKHFERYELLIIDEIPSCR